MKKITLIVPCYNEETCLPVFDVEISKIVEQMREYTFEILYIDDGSQDKTLETMRQICERRAYARYLSFSRNFGKEAAMYAGFSNATGDYVAVMDADLQDPPALLPEMVAILEKGEYDSVATRRVSREGEPPIRSFFARMFYKLINKISDADIVDGARDYRLMKREMVDVIVAMGEQNRFSKGIFGWIGFRTYWYAFENVERAAGRRNGAFETFEIFHRRYHQFFPGSTEYCVLDGNALHRFLTAGDNFYRRAQAFVRGCSTGMGI